MSSSSTDYCHELLKKLKILPLQSQHILSLLFVVRHRELFRCNYDVYNISMRYNSHLHLPIANLIVFQKSFLFWNYNF
jgi:hypothetical protein